MSKLRNFGGLSPPNSPRYATALLFLNFGTNLRDMRSTDWKGRERKWSRPTLKYYTAICAQELGKTTKKTSVTTACFLSSGLKLQFRTSWIWNKNGRPRCSVKGRYSRDNSWCPCGLINCAHRL